MLKTDAEGRVVEYRTWQALCGPPPPPNPNGQNSAVLTDKLLPGLVAEKDKQDCIASDKAPVLASVKQSEAWKDKDSHDPDTARWVRDGDS